MKKHLSTILFCLIFLTGLSLLLYPTVSNYLNERNQSRAIATFNKNVSSLSSTDYTDMLKKAEEYNSSLLQSGGNQFGTFQPEQEKEYDSLLNPGGDGIMGTIEIPSIGVNLPVYHGTADTVLQIGVGHIEGTSLPVGGNGTHAVLSGHRGLPSSKLFTDLDQLEKGDTFTIRVPGRVLTYEIDQIKTVLPEETQDLAIDPEKDYVTLVTCTPYAVNTHRLLVRGHRIPTPETETAKTETETAVRQSRHISPLTISTWIAEGVVALVLILAVFSLIRKVRKKKKKTDIRNKNEGK